MRPVLSSISRSTRFLTRKRFPHAGVSSSEYARPRCLRSSSRVAPISSSGPNLDDFACHEPELLAIDATRLRASFGRSGYAFRADGRSATRSSARTTRRKRDEPDVAVSDLARRTAPLAARSGVGRASDSVIWHRKTSSRPVSNDFSARVRAVTNARSSRRIRHRCVARDASAVDTLDPGLLPVDPALGLAAAVADPVAAQILEEDACRKPADELSGRVPADLLDRAWTTRNRLSTCGIISGMNGMPSTVPSSSSVARISRAERTSNEIAGAQELVVRSMHSLDRTLSCDSDVRAQAPDCHVTGCDYRSVVRLPRTSAEPEPRRPRR